MGISINTNISAIQVGRNLGKTSAGVAKSMERLSSGLRINRAADDAAGMGIATRMRSQLGGIEQARRNAQDGISMVQTADGALDEVVSILMRVRDLAVQYNNGTNSDEARAAITAEVTQLNSELGRIISATNFSGIDLLNGGSTTLQIGANQADTLAINNVALTVTLGTSVSAFAALTGTSADITGIQTTINGVSSARASLGATQNRLEHTISSLSVAHENTLAAVSRIQDVDVAQEMATLTRLQISQQAGVAMLAQANMSPQVALSLLR
jgi:flagellin